MLLDKRNRNAMVADSIRELKIEKNNFWQFLICIIIGCILGVILAFSSNTVELSGILFSTILDVDIALFAVILGSYAIFQALMRDDILRHLLSIESNILRDSNKTFLNLSVLYIVDAFISFCAKMVSVSIPYDWHVATFLASNILYLIIIVPYIVFFLLLILENINFVINLYRMFNVYTIYRALDILKEDDERQPK